MLLKTIPDQSPSNPLYLGTAIHEALETGDVADAITSYRKNYNIITDNHIHEEMKLEYLIPKVLEVLPDGECEVELMTDNFIGYIDRLIYLYTDEQGVSHYDIMDYKYSNNKTHYLESGQLHIYKYFFELTHPNTVVDHLRYVFIPKVFIRQKKNETVMEFRSRLMENLEALEVEVVDVPYNYEMVTQFLDDCQTVTNAKTYPRTASKLCDWCEFKEFCHSDGQISWNIICENPPKN